MRGVSLSVPWVQVNHMKTNKRKIIEQKVSELLRKSGITKAPIDVEIIASNLNINVRRTPTEDDRSIVKLRSKVSSSGEDQEEVEANRFAAELLMPGELLAKDLETLLLTDFLDERRMQQLAKRYAVSVQAMTNRLISLGYLHPDELGIS